MRRATWLLGLIAMAGLAGATGLLARTGSAPARGTSEASWDKYRVVASRNIFLRDRSHPAAVRPTGNEDRQPAGQTGSSLVLTGIGQSGALRMAVLEDPRAEKVVQAVAGEIIEGGCVIEVGMDGIVYERRGVTRRIALGQDLSGQSTLASGDSGATTQPVTAGAAASASQPAASATGAPGAPAAGLSEIEQRMKKRRARE